MTASVSVHVRFPYDDQSDDSNWLAESTVRHGGEVPDMFMLSDPMQCFVEFPSTSQAESFAAELTATGRWTAHRFGGCAICGNPK